MSDDQASFDAQKQPQPPGGEFGIKKIFVKDISFEAPNSPALFLEDWTPDSDVHLNSEARKLGPGEYEVWLQVTAKVTLGERTAFLADITVAGVFGITGLTTDEMGPTLGSFCPNILYPYAREIITDLSTRGGFPQFVIAPVNFEALYAKHIAAQYAEQDPAEAIGKTGRLTKRRR